MGVNFTLARVVVIGGKGTCNGAVSGGRFGGGGGAIGDGAIIVLLGACG